MHIDKYGVGWRDEYAARGFWLGIKAALALVVMLALAALLAGCGTSPEPAEPQITDAQFEAIVQNSRGTACPACGGVGGQHGAPVRFGAMTEGDGR